MSHGKKQRKLPKGDMLDTADLVMDYDRELRSRCESLHEVVSANIIPLEKGLKAYDVTMEQYLGYLMMQDKKIKISMNADVISSMVGVVLAFVDTNPKRIDEPAKQLVGDIRNLSAVARRKNRNRYYGKTTSNVIRSLKNANETTESPTVVSMIEKLAKRGVIQKRSKVKLKRKVVAAAKSKAVARSRAHIYK